MQALGRACSPDDDMLDGDLGDGMGVRGHRSSRVKSRSFSGVSEALPPGADGSRCSRPTDEPTWIPGLNSHESLQRTRWRLQGSGSMVDLSQDQLRGRLQEATEMIDLLCCELDVAHRYLEGKYEALKILQGKAILDRATSHTQSVLQKSEEKAKALEKEVNSLQWELSFSQVQMKKNQQSWEQSYSRILSENQTLTDSLEEREREIQQLRAENSALSCQCSELLSMLTVREQKVYQETKPQYSPDRDAGMLELAVLGACRCVGVAEVCPCSRTAAASRKQLIHLQQELDAQRSRREEAVMVADAFRIAFEQQLRKRSDHFLLAAEANILKTPHCRAEDANSSPLLSVRRRLRGLLPAGVEVTTSEEMLQTLHRLMDLLNDKEEALAHQRKVSIMLAHNAEELQRQLRQRPQPSDPAESRTASRPAPGPAVSRTASRPGPDPAESRTASRPGLDPAESRTASRPAPGPAESRTASRMAPGPAETRTAYRPTLDPAEFWTASRPAPGPAESRTASGPAPGPAESQSSCDTSKSKVQGPPVSSTQPESTHRNSKSEKTHSDPSKTRILAHAQAQNETQPRIQESDGQQSDPAESRSSSKSPQGPLRNKIQSEILQDHTNLKTAGSESRIPSTQPRQTRTPKSMSNHKIHKPETQLPEPPKSRIPLKQLRGQSGKQSDPQESRIPVSSVSIIHSQKYPAQPESQTLNPQKRPPSDPSESRTQERPPSDPSESRTQELLAQTQELKTTELHGSGLQPGLRSEFIRVQD